MSITLIRGLPGSGKSTLAKKFVRAGTHCIHIEADMFHMKNGVYQFNPSRIKEAHQWCQDTARIFHEQGYHVYVSNTFTQHWEMKPYKDMDITLEVIVCDGNYKNTHNVPDEVIQKMKQRWEN